MKHITEDYRKVLLVLLILIGIMSRFVNIGTQGIKIDETWVVPTPNFHLESDNIYPKLFAHPQFRNLSVSKQELIKKIYFIHPLLQVAAIRVASDVHPPLYFLINYYWSKWFGYEIEVIRALSVLYFVFTLFLLLYVLKRQNYDLTMKLLIIFFVVLSPFYLFLSNYARPYALLILLSLWSSYLCYRIVKDGFRKGAVVLYILISTACMYTHYFGILLVASQAVYFIYESVVNSNLKINWKKIVLIEIIIALLYAPWFFILLFQMQIRYGRLESNVAFRSINLETLTELFLFFGMGYSRSTVFSPLNIFVTFIQFVLFIFGISYLWKQRNSINSRFWLFYFICPFIFIVIANRITPVFTPRNCTIILIPYLVICGFGLYAQRTAYIKVILSTIIGIVGCYYIFYGLSYGNVKGKYAIEDWKSVGIYLKSNLNEIPIYVHHSSYSDALYYYIKDEKRVKGFDEKFSVSGPADDKFVFVLVNHRIEPVSEKIARELPFLANQEKSDVKLLKKAAQIYIYKVSKKRYFLKYMSMQ